jgi:hypothetical protein
MIVEIIDRIGRQPIRLDASQVLVRNNAGTPIAIAGEYGPEGVIKTAHAQDDDFNQVLAAFGCNGRVVVKTLQLDHLGIPRGLRPVAGPGVR